MEIAQLVVTSLIALVGLYVANSFWRQQRLKVAEKRISAYRALWQVMEATEQATGAIKGTSAPQAKSGLFTGETTPGSTPGRPPVSPGEPRIATVSSAAESNERPGGNRPPQCVEAPIPPRDSDDSVWSRDARAIRYPRERRSGRCRKASSRRRSRSSSAGLSVGTSTAQRSRTLEIWSAVARST
jgi:hypothetical protein